MTVLLLNAEIVLGAENTPVDKVTVLANKKLTDFLILCQLAVITFSSKKCLVDRTLEFHRTQFNNLQMMTQASCVMQVLFAKLKVLSTYLNFKFK